MNNYSDDICNKYLCTVTMFSFVFLALAIAGVVAIGALIFLGI